MRIELTIKASYLPDWGLWEGVREIIQNAKDADTEGYDMKVFMSKNGTLSIFNKGAQLPHEALLLGHTTKDNDSSQIGQFGEGLKLGVLALVRDGYKVRIRSGNELWTPKIIESKNFDNTTVLAFDIRKTKQSDGVTVEIYGVKHSDWEDFSKKILFLSECKKRSSYNGDVILDQELQGNLYVKGIFVQNDPRLHYAYNFSNIDVDRDRKMINSWELEWSLVTLWKAVLSSEVGDLDMYNRVLSLLESDSFDLKGFSSSTSSSGLPESFITFISEWFHTKYGKDAIAVTDLLESRAIEHFGKQGIVVSKQLSCVILNGNTIESIKTSLANEIVERFGWHQLDKIERNNIDESIELINSTRVSIQISNIEIVTFRSDSLYGVFDNGKIIINKKILSNKKKTLRTFVHEVAHNVGGDGSKSHVNLIEEIWSDIVEGFR